MIEELDCTQKINLQLVIASHLCDAATVDQADLSPVAQEMGRQYVRGKLRKIRELHEIYERMSKDEKAN